MTQRRHDLCGPECRYRGLYEGAQTSLTDLAAKQASVLARHGKLRQAVVSTLKSMLPRRFQELEQRANARLSEVDDDTFVSYVQWLLQAPSDPEGLAPGLAALRDALGKAGIDVSDTDPAAWAAQVQARFGDPWFQASYTPTTSSQPGQHTPAASAGSPRSLHDLFSDTPPATSAPDLPVAKEVPVVKEVPVAKELPVEKKPESNHQQGFDDLFDVDDPFASERAEQAANTAPSSPVIQDAPSKTDQAPAKTSPPSPSDDSEEGSVDTNTAGPRDEEHRNSLDEVRGVRTQEVLDLVQDGEVRGNDPHGESTFSDIHESEEEGAEEGAASLGDAFDEDSPFDETSPLDEGSPFEDDVFGTEEFSGEGLIDDDADALADLDDFDDLGDINSNDVSPEPGAQDGEELGAQQGDHTASAVAASAAADTDVPQAAHGRVASQPTPVPPSAELNGTGDEPAASDRLFDVPQRIAKAPALRPEIGARPSPGAAKRTRKRSSKNVVTPSLDLPGSLLPAALDAESVSRIDALVTIPRPVFTSDLIEQTGSAELIESWQEHRRRESGITFIAPKRRHRLRGSLLLPTGWLRDAQFEFQDSWWADIVNTPQFRGSVIYELGALLHRVGDQVVSWRINQNRETVLLRLRSSRGIIGVVVAVGKDLEPEGTTSAAVVAEVEELFRERCEIIVVLSVTDAGLDQTVALLDLESQRRRWRPPCHVVAAHSWEYQDGAVTALRHVLG